MKITIKDLYDFNLETDLINKGKFKVKTKNGFKKIDAIDITDISSKIVINTKSDKIKTSPDHLLSKFDDWIFVKNLKIGDYIDCINGPEQITNIEIDEIVEELYDIQVDGEEYFANNFRTHNSSLRQCIDFALFHKVRGKTKKVLSVKKLPNRHNKSLYVGLWFDNYKGDEIVIKKYLEPQKFEMTINEEPFEKKFSKMTDPEKENLLGFSYNIFQNFISMSLNNFKNFVSLSKDDKETVLNKLFNLEELNSLQNITKQLKKDLQKNRSSVYEELQEKKTRIDELNNIISKLNSNNSINKVERIKEINIKLVEYKNRSGILTNKNIEISKEIEVYNQKLMKFASNKTQGDRMITTNELKIENIEEKLDAFNKGICPICDSNLNTNKHKSKIGEFSTTVKKLNEKNEEVEEQLIKVVTLDTKYRNKKSTLYNELSKNKQELDLIKENFTKFKLEKSSLKQQNFDSIDELNKEKELHKKRVNSLLPNFNKYKDKEPIYDELINIFSGDVIRNNIIKNILKSVNYYLQDFLTKLEYPYDVELDMNFNAIIKEKEKIDPETLSGGEDKKINVAIALSYLCLILDVKHSNLLFLDEIFDSIDIESVDLLLNLLKEISEKYKINIIIVHHNDVNLQHFDRIIRTKKDLFSDIEEIDLVNEKN